VAGIEHGQVDARPQPFSPFGVTGGDEEAGYRVAHVNLMGQPGAATASGLAGWQAMAQAYAPADRLVWERRTLFGQEPQVRALKELLWRRPDFAAGEALR